MEKLIELKCKCCEKPFNKIEREYKRRLKKGALYFFCSLKCSSSYINKNKFKEWYGKFTSNLKKGRELDVYSPFRKMFRLAVYRNKLKNINTDLDLEYLKEIWDAQKGLCALSNISMELGKKMSPKIASLDRIDSSKGYIKGNVQFVCLSINYAKNNFQNDEIKEFIQLIKKI